MDYFSIYLILWYLLTEFRNSPQSFYLFLSMLWDFHLGNMMTCLQFQIPLVCCWSIGKRLILYPTTLFIIPGDFCWWLFWISYINNYVICKLKKHFLYLTNPFTFFFWHNKQDFQYDAKSSCGVITLAPGHNGNALSFLLLGVITLLLLFYFFSG